MLQATVALWGSAGVKLPVGMPAPARDSEAGAEVGLLHGPAVETVCPIRSPHPVHHDSPPQTLAWAVRTQGQHHGALSALTGWSPWKPLFYFSYVLFPKFHFVFLI